MSKVTQIVAKPFADTASAGQIGEFGSKAAGTPSTTTDPTVMQSLSQWSQGWNNAVIDGNSPCIEDLNAFCFVVMYLFTYLQEMGVSEWNAGITYFTGSIVNVSGRLYVSLVDTNLNNSVTDPTKWAAYGKTSRTVTGTDTATTSDGIIWCNSTSGSFLENLPAASSCPKNFTLVVKNVGTTAGNTVTITPNGADTIDGASNWVLTTGSTITGGLVMESVTLVAASGVWYIV